MKILYSKCEWRWDEEWWAALPWPWSPHPLTYRGEQRTRHLNHYAHKHRISSRDWHSYSSCSRHHHPSIHTHTHTQTLTQQKYSPNEDKGWHFWCCQLVGRATLRGGGMRGGWGGGLMIKLSPDLAFDRSKSQFTVTWLWHSQPTHPPSLVTDPPPPPPFPNPHLGDNTNYDPDRATGVVGPVPQSCVSGWQQYKGSNYHVASQQGETVKLTI